MRKRRQRKSIALLAAAVLMAAALPMGVCAGEGAAAGSPEALDAGSIQPAETALLAENASEQQSVNDAKDAAAAQSFHIRTYNDRRAEDDQNIEVTVTFDRAIEVKSGAESDISVKIAGSSLDQSPNTENGESNRTLSVKADAQDDRKLVITVGSCAGAQFVKQTNASIQIQASDAGITHILTAGSGVPADLRYIETTIPCGLALSDVSSETGSAPQDGAVQKEASVTKQVTHRANVRSMVYIQLLKNGKPILPEDKFDHAGSYVIHAHAFIDTMSGDTKLPELTEADYAKLIVQGFENSIKNLKDLASRYMMTQEGDKITLTDHWPEDGETLDVRVYAWPYDGSVVSDVPSAGNGSGNGDTSVFDDVNGWEKEYVYYLAEKGIVKGRTDTLFVPLANVTRAEFIKMLASAAGASVSGNEKSSFSDVPASAWYAPYVAWAEKNGLANGSDGKFYPLENITKQDIAVLIQRYAENVAGTEIPNMEAESIFADDTAISGYAKSAVYELQKGSIVSGDINGKFYPKSSATRAQAAKMLAVFLQVSGK